MNDRAVLVAAAVLAAVVLGLGALWVLRDYAQPTFVNGDAVAHHADVMVGDMIAARFPGIRVGPARCPELLDLTGVRNARCAIPVAGNELSIGVAMRPDRRDLVFNDVDSLFVASDAERAIGRKLEAMYGERFGVRCPGAAVRVVPRATPVSCDVEAPDVTKRQLNVTLYGERGAVQFEELAGVTTREARILGAAVAAQREGSVTVDGRALARYVRGSAAALDFGEVARRGLLGAAHCPPRVVLREGMHARCTVAVADVTLRYDVHFEKGLGLRADRDISVTVVPALHEFALRYFERRRAGADVPFHVEVNCGTVPVVVEEPGSTLRCHAEVGGAPFYFAFRFLDADGDFIMEESAGT